MNDFRLIASIPLTGRRLSTSLIHDTAQTALLTFHGPFIPTEILATGLQYLRSSLTHGCSGVYRTRRMLSYLEYQNSILHLNYTNFILTLGPKRNRKCECAENGCQCAAHT